MTPQNISEKICVYMSRPEVKLELVLQQARTKLEESKPTQIEETRTGIRPIENGYDWIDYLH